MEECRADAAVLQGVFVSSQERIRADAPLCTEQPWGGGEDSNQSFESEHWSNGLRACLAYVAKCLFAELRGRRGAE